MKCSFMKLRGRAVVLCGGQRYGACVTCQEPAGYQCDWKVGNFRCDAHICADHAEKVDKNKHLCPEHQKIWDNHPANKQRKLL